MQTTSAAFLSTPVSQSIFHAKRKSVRRFGKSQTFSQQNIYLEKWNIGLLIYFFLQILFLLFYLNIKEYTSIIKNSFFLLSLFSTKRNFGGFSQSFLHKLFIGILSFETFWFTVDVLWINMERCLLSFFFLVKRSFFSSLKTCQRSMFCDLPLL